jgi:hypothetical protein
MIWLGVSASDNGSLGIFFSPLLLRLKIGLVFYDTTIAIVM